MQKPPINAEKVKKVKFDGQTDGWMDDWTDGQMDDWTNGRMDEWTDERMDGRTQHKESLPRLPSCGHLHYWPKSVSPGEL